MATKKKKKKKPAPKKKVLKKKKPVAKKKKVAKKAVTKKKVAKKIAKTTSAPKKKVAKAKPAPAAAPAKTNGERLSAFSPVLEELVSWVNDGRAGSIDFEMYAAFNEQYKPSDWTRNPSSDDELFTFGMDGTGGQVALWRRKRGAIEELPVVFMGSEGEVRPLATSLPKFLFLIASGLGPLEITSGDGEATPNDEMIAWVKSSFPKETFPAPDKILAEASKALADFESHLMASVPAE